MDSNVCFPRVSTAANPLPTGAVRRPAPEVVVLDDPTRRKKKSPPSQQVLELAKKAAAIEAAKAKPGRARYRNKKKKLKTPLEQFRLDVKKLGTSGFHEVVQDKINEKLAIKLGAKPPKKKFFNYKDVMENVKEEREKEKTEREIKRKLGFEVKKPTPKADKLKTKTKLNSFSCQVGYYKDGFQHIPKQLVQSMKKK